MIETLEYYKVYCEGGCGAFMLSHLWMDKEEFIQFLKDQGWVMTYTDVCPNCQIKVGV